MSDDGPAVLCWWCQALPATTGEHKFKASDLKRMIRSDGLVWGDGAGDQKHIAAQGAIRRDRHGVLKFPKSMCAECNNRRSQPFDRAYDTFAEHVSTHVVRGMPGIDFQQVYGEQWSERLLDLARYFGKHFGCELVSYGFPAPAPLRRFLDGATDLDDIHVALVTTDTVHRRFKQGLSRGYTTNSGPNSSVSRRPG